MKKKKGRKKGTFQETSPQISQFFGFAVSFVVLMLAAGGVLAQQEESSAGEVKIIYRHMEKTKERIYATGDVEIHYKNLTLFADRIEYNPETKDVFAEGNVVLHTADEVMSAEKAFFNLESARGELHKVFGQIQPTIFYQADVIRKKQENLYSLEKAWLTSCTQPVPRWNFSCSRANFKKDDYMEMWNAVLKIKKVPVMYMPYFRYPLDRERSTGFLMPQVGYSAVKGMTVTQSFYWAMARNMDSTFTLDYYSARGVGAGFEYRYLFRGGAGGEAHIYYFNFKREPDGYDPPNAYIVRLAHNQPLPFNFSLVANIDYQSNFNFLREFDNNVKRALIFNRRSEAYIARPWSYFNLSMRASQFETHFMQIDNSIIMRYLPQISLSSFKIKLFSPLYFSFSSGFSRWQYGWKSQYKAGRQTQSENLSFHPMLSLPLSGIPWLTMNIYLEGDFVLHFKTYKPGKRRIAVNIVNEPLFVKSTAVGVDLVGPVFYKIFYTSEGEAKVKHIIEPSMSYRYSSPVESAIRERIITVSDYFFRYHQMTYGLTNRLIVKSDGMPKEVFTWGIGQTCYLAPEEGPLSIFRVNGEIPRFSEVTSYMRFYPFGNYSLDFSAGFNTYKKTFSGLRAGTGIGRPSDIAFISVSWFKSMNPWYKDVLGDRHQVSAWGGLKIPGLSLETQAEMEFNITERKLLFVGAALVYHYQCLDFRADFRLFNFREKPEPQFKFSVGLGNIGKTTDFLGGLNF